MIHLLYPLLPDSHLYQFVTDYFSFSIPIVVVGILGAVIIEVLLSYFSPLIKKFKDYLKKNKLERKIKKITHSNYTPLIPSPTYEINGFPIDIIFNRFIWPIPTDGDRRTRLSKKLHSGKPQRINEHIYIHKENIEKITKGYFQPYIPNANKFLNETANEITNKFIEDLKTNKLRFNKWLHGVSKIKGKKMIQLYHSDYFTFKFTVHAYNKLKKIISTNSLQTPLSHYTGLKHIERLKSFLNSIGIGGFLIPDGGKEDEIVFGWRDSRSCESGGYWHFTYDETFTPDDVANDTKGENGMITCLRRALFGEVGLTCHQQKIYIHPNHMGIINVGTTHTDGNDNRFEFEVCPFARLCFSDEFTIDDFINSYQFAKDAAVETSNLHFVPITKLNEFSMNEKNSFSLEARRLCLQLKIRIEEEVIANDYTYFEDIK